jgi:hypothetical protein
MSEKRMTSRDPSGTLFGAAPINPDYLEVFTSITRHNPWTVGRNGTVYGEDSDVEEDDECLWFIDGEDESLHDDEPEENYDDLWDQYFW